MPHQVCGTKATSNLENDFWIKRIKLEKIAGYFSQVTCGLIENLIERQLRAVTRLITQCVKHRYVEHIHLSDALLGFIQLVCGARTERNSPALESFSPIQLVPKVIAVLY